MIQEPKPTAHSLQLAALAWCTPKTREIEMDTELAEAFAVILDEHFASIERPSPQGEPANGGQRFLLSQVLWAEDNGGISTALIAQIQTALTAEAPQGERQAPALPEAVREALEEIRSLLLICYNDAETINWPRLESVNKLEGDCLKDIRLKADRAISVVDAALSSPRSNGMRGDDAT